MMPGYTATPALIDALAAILADPTDPIGVAVTTGELPLSIWLREELAGRGQRWDHTRLPTPEDPAHGKRSNRADFQTIEDQVLTAWRTLTGST